MNQLIYCISGLGADEKVFSNLQMNGHRLEYIPWIRPHKNERMEHYAERMAEYIKHEQPVILGVSFGGMVGLEIAKQVPLKKLIIVSSIKSHSEMPQWMKLVASLHLHKFLPTRSNKFTEKIDNDRLGVTTDEEREMVKAYRKKVDPIYFNWAINQVLNWKNDWQPEHLIHIHGDKDKIFPIKKINPTHVIKEGTHMMIHNRAGEISRVLKKVLDQ